MASKNLKSKERKNLLATPETERRKADRKGSSRRRHSSLTDNSKNKNDEENLNLLGKPVEESKRPISREERAQIKFGHPVYSKAASLFESLKGTIEEVPKLEFENEFVKRRAYSLAFAGKRCE